MDPSRWEVLCLFSWHLSWRAKFGLRQCTKVKAYLTGLVVSTFIFIFVISVYALPAILCLMLSYSTRTNDYLSQWRGQGWKMGQSLNFKILCPLLKLILPKHFPSPNFLMVESFVCTEFTPVRHCWSPIWECDVVCSGQQFGDSGLIANLSSIKSSFELCRQAACGSLLKHPPSLSWGWLSSR